MSQSENTENESPKRSGNALASAARILIPATILGVGIWFGMKTLQKTNQEEPAAAPQQGGGPPPSQVVVAPVLKVTAQNVHRVVGSLRAAQRADVAAREEGAVLEVLADEGSKVEQHQILVRLDARRLEAQMAQAQATLTAARSVITQREAEKNRTDTDLAMKRKLFNEEAISESEFLDAERASKVTISQVKASRDSVSAAAAALKLLQVRKDDLVIRAPFNARVVTRHAEPGEWLRPGDPVLTLVSDGQLEAWLQIPERYAASLGTANITVEIGGKIHPATNLRAVPEADAASRVVTLIADIADPDGLLVPGLSVTAEVAVSDDTPRLSVPADAVVTTFAGPAVFRAKKSEGGPAIAERLPVKILFQQEGIVFLESDALNESDVVVIEGNERLFPMTPLLFEPPQPTAEQTALQAPEPLASSK
ncbi:MAG: efflux RND transporter periplasmic adaptor subunit [Roseibacillus sp.]